MRGDERRCGRICSTSGTSVWSARITWSPASSTIQAIWAGASRRLSVCRTAPMQGTATYASRCSCWFQRSVATRSPRPMPSACSACARRPARSSTSPSVERRTVLTPFVTTGRSRCSGAARRRSKSPVSGTSIICPSTAPSPAVVNRSRTDSPSRRRAAPVRGLREALARLAHQHDRLREEHPDRIADLARLLLRRALEVEPRDARDRHLHRQVDRVVGPRDLLGALHLLGHLLQVPLQVLGVAPEHAEESASAFHVKRSSSSKSSGTVTAG